MKFLYLNYAILASVQGKKIIILKESPECLLIYE